MNNQLLFNTRLLLFAGHIASVNNHPEHGLTTQYPMVELYMGVNIHYHLKCHDYIFEELLVFENSWTYDDYGSPILIGREPNTTMACVIDFFGLDSEELAFCFDLDGFQDIETFGGGHVLSEASTGMHIAENIRIVVQRRRKR